MLVVSSKSSSNKSSSATCTECSLTAANVALEPPADSIKLQVAAVGGVQKEGLEPAAAWTWLHILGGFAGEVLKALLASVIGTRT